jgi:hypothetical protein
MELEYLDGYPINLQFKHDISCKDTQLIDIDDETVPILFILELTRRQSRTVTATVTVGVTVAVTDAVTDAEAESTPLQRFGSDAIYDMNVIGIIRDYLITHKPCKSRASTTWTRAWYQCSHSHGHSHMSLVTITVSA